MECSVRIYYEVWDVESQQFIKKDLVVREEGRPHEVAAYAMAKAVMDGAAQSRPMSYEVFGRREI